MSEKKTDGLPPTYFTDKHALSMTLRDAFALGAMQGICASKDEAGVLINHGYEWIASESYKIADAMLKEREK